MVGVTANLRGQENLGCFLLVLSQNANFFYVHDLLAIERRLIGDEVELGPSRLLQ